MNTGFSQTANLPNVTKSHTVRPRHGIIVIHGIGKQKRHQTVQTVVSRFAQCSGCSFRIPIGEIANQIERDGHDNPPNWAVFDLIPGYAFSEVYWSDIATTQVNRAMPDLVTWSMDIPDQISYIERQYYGKPGLEAPTRDTIRTVIDDSIWNVRLMRYLLSRYRVETDEMVEFLRHFVASVQVFAEFDEIRKQIMSRFHSSMLNLVENASCNGIGSVHICGHSLGSAIAFLGMLEAYNIPSKNERWLNQCKTYCTIGSPIDLFMPLWKNLWIPFESNAQELSPRGRGEVMDISWHNLADHDDPIASSLDVTRQWVHKYAPGLFGTGSPEDYAFRGANWPGGAHLDYWRNPRVFKTWIDAINQDSMAMDECNKKPLDSHHDEEADIASPVEQEARASANRVPSAKFAVAHRGVLPYRTNRSSTRGFNWGILSVPILLAVTVGWLVVYWMEANYGPTKLNRVNEALLGIMIGVQVFFQVVSGSCCRSSRRPFWIGLASLAIAGIIGISFIMAWRLEPLWSISFENLHIAFAAPFVMCWAGALLIASCLQILLDRTFVRLRKSKSIALLCSLSIVLALLPIRPHASDNLQDTAADIIGWGLIFVLWWVATLWWRFQVVWTDYVSGRQHIYLLCRRWGLLTKESSRTLADSPVRRSE